MKKNLLPILIGGAAVYYFFFRKKAVVPVIPKAAVVPTSLPKPKEGYPSGLVEGDYVKGGSDATVYVLYKGEKRPMTAAWAARYAVGTWDRTKFVDQVVLMDIPTGSVLDV